MWLPLLMSWLCLVCQIIGTSAPALASDTGLDLPVHLEVDAVFFFDNTEYHNPYWTGRTLCGAYTSPYLIYERPFIDLSLGAFLRRDFGDEQEVSEALPLFRFRCKMPHFRLLAGVIDSKNNHGLPDVLLMRQYGLIQPIEEGLQVFARDKNLSAEAWISWYLRNTPEHREFFAAGLTGKALWPLVSAEVAFRVSHHGGQLYNAGPVSDNFSGMLRWTVSDDWAAIDGGLGFVGALLGSVDNQERSIASDNEEGFGVDLEFFIAPKGWRLYYSLFSGRDLIVEQGNPLYRTRQAFHRFGLLKVFRIEDLVRFRFQAEGVVIDSDLEYNYSLTIDAFLKIFG